MTAGQATGVVVIPDFPTKSWHPKVQQMLVKEPVLLEARKDLLKRPSHPSEVSPTLAQTQSTGLYLIRGND